MKTDRFWKWICKILCKILHHKYKTIYNIFKEPIKEKCKRCGYIIDFRYNIGGIIDNTKRNKTIGLPASEEYRKAWPALDNNEPDCTLMYLIDGKEHHINVKWDMRTEEEKKYPEWFNTKQGKTYVTNTFNTESKNRGEFKQIK